MLPWPSARFDQRLGLALAGLAMLTAANAFTQGVFTQGVFIQGAFAQGSSARSASAQGALAQGALAQGALAQTHGDPETGHEIATKWCSNCHIVDRETKSGASTGAPTFPAIAQRKDVTPMGLRVFLQTPHDRMPDLHLSRAEMDDLIAYILSLRQ